VYSNLEVSSWLREHVVLHWSSERAVPTVRIDFGGGKMLEGTLTGNSAHYLLDELGRPLDVFPGLYGPQALLAGLREAEPFARRAAALDDDLLASELRRRHQRALEFSESELAADLRRIGLPAPESEARRAFRERPAAVAEPTALDATERTLAKSRSEAPLLEATLGRRPDSADGLPIELLARLAPHRATCDAGCRALVEKRVDWLGEPMPSAIERFEEMLAADTVRNEIRLHAEIHRWFMDAEAALDFAALNRRVYDELFLSPGGDPWLGLAPREVFSVLRPPSAEAAAH
jgi:predicted nucleic acid-binding protein